MKAYLPIFSLIVLIAVAGCKSQVKEKKIPAADTTDIVLQQLEQQVNQYPDSVVLFRTLIDTLTNRGKYAEAANWCNHLIGRGADSNYYYWYIKGDIFRKGKMYDSAIASYQSYLSKFPDDQEILLNLGYTFGEAGDSNAIKLANIIGRRFATRDMRSEAAFIKGVYFNTVKKYAEARKWLETCLLLNYNYFEAYMEKGFSYYDEGKYNEALMSFNTLANLNNNYAEAYYWMAKCNEAMGQKKEAISNYAQAYALDNTIVEAKAALTRLQKEGGN